MFKENFDSKKETECILKTSEAPKHLNSAKMLTALALVALVCAVIFSALGAFVNWYIKVGVAGRLNLGYFLIHFIMNIIEDVPWVLLLISVFRFRKELKPTLFFPIALLTRGCAFLISAHTTYTTYSSYFEFYANNNLEIIELTPFLLNAIIYFIVGTNFIFATVLTFFKGSLKKIFLIIVSGEIVLWVLYSFIYLLVAGSGDFLFIGFSLVSNLAFAAVLMIFALKNEIPVSCFSFRKKDKTFNEK